MRFCSPFDAVGLERRLGHRRLRPDSRARPGAAGAGERVERGDGYTQVQRNGKLARLLLAKNPAGWLEAFDVLAPIPVPVLLAVNAQTPDGKDTSWLWDVDYRVLLGRPVYVTGERRLDLAVRLEADQVPFELVDGIDDTTGKVSGAELDVIANYTAFQQIRALVGRTE